jgi:hypothetical protein
MRYALSQACTCEEQYEPEHTYKFTGPCLKTGKPYSVTVPADGLYQYHQGKHIQDAFPNLSADDREFLMSGYSPEGWNLVFGSEEDDDDESPDVFGGLDSLYHTDLSDPPGGEG